MKKFKLLLFCIHLLLIQAYAQHEISAMGGIHQSGFYGSGDESHYMHYVASLSCKKPITDKLFTGVEVENMHVKSHLEIIRRSEVAQVVHSDLLMNLNYVNVHLLFGRTFGVLQKAKISAALSPYYGVLLYSNAVGHETKSLSCVYVDSSGQTRTILCDQKQDIHESPSKRMRMANIGICLQLNATCKLTEKLAIIFKTSYNLGLYEVMEADAFTGIRGYTLLTGLTYFLSK